MYCIDFELHLNYSSINFVILCTVLFIGCFGVSEFVLLPNSSLPYPNEIVLGIYHYYKTQPYFE